MARQRQAIGVDIGLNGLKMVWLGQGGDYIKLIDYRIIDYNQQDMFKEKPYQEIFSFLSAVNPEHTIPLIVSVQGDQVFTRVFKLPAVGRSKLAKIVGYEAQQQVPFPIEDVVWSYKCLQKLSPDESDVVLVAVKKDVVNTFLDSFKKAGIMPDDVTAPIIGLHQFLNYSISIQKQAVLILDIGAKTTNIIITEGRNRWFRIVPIAGDDITRDIASEFNLSFSDAEILKKEKGDVGLDSTAEKRISSCILKSIIRLTGEITRSIDVYCSSFNSLGIKHIFITGGTSQLRNIGQFLTKKFRIETKELDTSKTFRIGSGIKKGLLERDASRLAVSSGLALQGLGRPGLRLSLLPKREARKGQWNKRRAYTITFTLLLLFLGFSFSEYNIQISNIYRMGIQKSKSEKKALDFNKKELKRIEKGLNIVKEKLDSAAEAVYSRTLWTDMLLGLERIIPKDVWLTRIELKKSKKGTNYADTADGIALEIYGQTTGTYEQVVAFRDTLNNSSYFLKGSATVISANPPEKGVRDFVIDVKMKVEPS